MSDELKPILDRLRKIGYDGTEFFVGSPDEAAYRRIGDYCENIGLEVTNVFVLGPEENPISADSIGVWREFSEPWEMAESGYSFINEMGKKHGL